MRAFNCPSFLCPIAVAKWLCISTLSELYENVYITFSSLRHTRLGYFFYLQCFAPAERFFCFSVGFCPWIELFGICPFAF